MGLGAMRRSLADELFLTESILFPIPDSATAFAMYVHVPRSVVSRCDVNVLRKWVSIELCGACATHVRRLAEG